MQELLIGEKQLLLRKAEETIKPPLTNLIRTHNPTPYMNMHLQASSSVGKLYRAGRSLNNYVKTYIAKDNTPLVGSYI